MKIISEDLVFGGRQLTVEHQSAATGTRMRVAVYLPPLAEDHEVPGVVYLSGLTYTEDNVTQKAGAQRVCAELGLAFIAPDTSPRGEGVADDPAYDLGQGAGFYVDATQTPWAPHFRMYSYICEDLLTLIDGLPADREALGLTGHSMGGHGALTIGLKNPDKFKSLSAFSPIVSPSNCPWGEKALGAYLGPDKTKWLKHDACALLDDGATNPETILVDQGEADDFLEAQLRTGLLIDACDRAGQKAEINMRPGYDHSYFFIATFIEAHLRHHAAALTSQAIHACGDS